MAKKGRKVGRITLPDWRQDGLRALLMLYYEDNFEFRKEWLWLLYRYERLVEALARAKHRDPHVDTCLHDDLAWEALEASIESGRVPTKVGGERQSRNIHLRRYREDLIALCDKWGLRCYWAPAWVHASLLEYVTRIMPAEEIAKLFGLGLPGVQAALLKSGFEPGRTPARQIRNRWRRYVQGTQEELPDLPRLVPLRFTFNDPISDWQIDERQDHLYLRHVRSHGSPTSKNTIRVEVEYQPWPVDDWQDVQKRILKEARRRRNEIRRAWVKAGWSLRDKEPKLPRNVRWLYERIALGLTPPRKMQALARGDGPPEDLEEYANASEGFEFTYRDATSKAAKEMGISLPRGAPRKHEK
jgi:hypothetical protein